MNRLILVYVYFFSSIAMAEVTFNPNDESEVNVLIENPVMPGQSAVEELQTFVSNYDRNGNLEELLVATRVLNSNRDRCSAFDRARVGLERANRDQNEFYIDAFSYYYGMLSIRFNTRECPNARLASDAHENQILPIAALQRAASSRHLSDEWRTVAHLDSSSYIIDRLQSERQGSRSHYEELVRQSLHHIQRAVYFCGSTECRRSSVSLLRQLRDRIYPVTQGGEFFRGSREAHEWDLQQAQENQQSHRIEQLELHLQNYDESVATYVEPMRALIDAAIRDAQQR